MKPILLKVDEAELERWKLEAKQSGLTLSAWIRMKCSEEDCETSEDKMIRIISSPRKQMQATAVNESNRQYYHTATSSRFDCLCPTCTDYRAKNDIPLGGFKK